MNLRFLAPLLLVTAPLRGRCAEAALDSHGADREEEGTPFSDDFERADPGRDNGWAIVVLAYSLESGTLKGTQMRFDAPAKAGKAALKGHQAVIGIDIPTKNGVTGFRFQPGGAQSVTAEWLQELSARFTEEFGRGSSPENQSRRRRFFPDWQGSAQIFQKASDKLGAIGIGFLSAPTPGRGTAS